MDRSRPLTSVVALACVLGLSCKEAPPPLGEALFIVDTDAPVPALVGRLRIDFYTDRGTWFASRDVAAPDPSAWPVSFSVFNPDEASTRVVLARLRAYPEGKTRDYRGERFSSREGEDPPARDLRLVVGGADVTPRVEPQPGLTIDRLVRVELEPGRVGSVRIVLHGACFGTMVDLANGATCVDTENERAALVTATSEPDTSLPQQSLQGGFGRSEPCDGRPNEGEVCVPGGAFILGSASEYGKGDGDGTPERVAFVHAFYMDRLEYTVARWRAARTNSSNPDTGSGVVLNEGPLAVESKDPRDDALCTVSSRPRDREDHPLTCVPWTTAQGLCRLAGGDLPTEAQWEYAAMVAGHSAKSPFPWGVEPATCGRAVHGRFAGLGLGRNACKADGYGPLPVGEYDRPDGDVTPLGIVGLGGGVSELLSDAFAGYEAPCWRSTGLVDPHCATSANGQRSLRGGNWASNVVGLNPQSRRGVGVKTYSESVGFRCVRAAGRSTTKEGSP